MPAWLWVAFGALISVMAGYLAVRTVTRHRQLRPTSPAQSRSKPPLRRPVDHDVQFTVYRPRTVLPGQWHTMIAFAHLAERRPGAPEGEPDPIEQVRQQAASALGAAIKDYRDTTTDSRQAVPQEGELTFLPSVPGITFNPDRRVFLWLEDVHREEFRLKADAELDGTTARGRFSVYLGSILLAEVEMAIKVDGQVQAPGANPESAQVDHARPYRRIFASYSHRDVEIVRQFERFARSFGDRYLRDVVDLRAGEHWGPGLLRLIEEADVFQLFWSTNSMSSEFVQREWEHALSLGRTAFVRPTYWEEPLPETPDHSLPPEALRQLHFHRLVVADPPDIGQQLSGPLENLAPGPSAAPRRRNPARVVGMMMSVLFVALVPTYLIFQKQNEQLLIALRERDEMKDEVAAVRARGMTRDMINNMAGDPTIDQAAPPPPPTSRSTEAAVASIKELIETAKEQLKNLTGAPRVRQELEIADLSLIGAALLTRDQASAADVDRFLKESVQYTREARETAARVAETTLLIDCLRRLGRALEESKQFEEAAQIYREGAANATSPAETNEFRNALKRLTPSVTPAPG